MKGVESMAGEDRNRKSNKTSKSTRSNDSSENFSGLVGNYSRALDRSADSLKSAAKDFKDSAKEITNNSDRNTDRIIKALSSFAKAFDKQVDDIDDLFSGNNKEQKSEFEKNLEKYVGENKKNLTKTQAVLSATIKTFAVVANAVNRNFQRGFNSILNNYNENYSSITARMNKSNKDYTDMLMDSTKKIRQESLTNQFSQIDFTKALQDVLAQGIRDIDDKNTASEMAYNNMITNQVLPMISTNTRTYVRYSKLLGDTFSKGITTIGTEIQKTYGAEGLEQGQADAFLDTMSADIFSSAIEAGKSQEEAVEMLQDAMSAYGDLSGKYGSQVAEYALGQLKDYLDNPGSANAVTIEAASRAGIEYGGSVSGQQFTAFLNNLIGDYQDYTSGIGKGIGGEALGISPDILRLVQAAQSWGDKSPIESLKVNTDQAYGELKSELSDGFTRSITAQADKWNENLMSGLADAAGQYIPHADEVLSDIWRIVKIWFAAWAAKGVFGGGEGGTSLFNKIGSSDIMGSSLKGQIAGIPSQGLGEALKSGGLGGSLSGLGTALGVAGIAAGTIWAGVDAWKAGSRAAENNMSTGQVIGQGARSFFTGSSTAGMTSDQKKAYYEQNGYFNFKDAALNAGKWALVGGGAGTLAGGPLGTAIGAVAGGIVGFATNAIDQAIDAHHYKELAEASENASKSVQALSKASSDYKSVMKKTENVQEYLNDLNSKDTETREVAFEALKSQYPEYLSNIESVKDLDKDYIEVIKTKIELEKLQAKNDALTALKDTSVDTSEYAKDMLSYGGKEFAEWASNNKGFSEEEANAKVKEIADKYYNGNLQETWKILRSDFGSSVINEGVWSQELDDYKYSFDTGNGESVFNYDFSSSLGTHLDASNSVFSEQYQILLKGYAALQDAYYQKDMEYAKEAAQDLSEELERFYEPLTGPVAKEFRARFRNDFKDIDTYYNYVGITGDDVPHYRTGINKIQRDSLAEVHQGEAVLNSAVASKARELSEGGIAGFINSLYGLVNTQVTAVGQSSQDVISPVVESINKQTDILSDLLSLILQDTTTLSRKLSGGPANRSQVDERLRSFSR